LNGENTKVEYLFPQSIEDATLLKEQYGDRARFIAGGTDLMLLMEREQYRPDVLIDITRIPSLQKLDVSAQTVTIGAAVTYSELLASKTLCDAVPFLAKAIRTIGGVQVRNIATMVGNLANASPAGDTLPTLYALEAEVHTFGPQGSHLMPVGQFVLDVRKTALKPGELITHVSFELPKPHWYGSFQKLGLRRSMAIALASVAVLLHIDDGVIKQARIALGSVAPTVIRASAAEGSLVGSSLEEDRIERAGQLSSEVSKPIDDVRGSAHYRKAVVIGLVRRALNELRPQIQG
jgi:CO/xanthine dehydrogenase FAD-binding subunit